MSALFRVDRNANRNTTPCGMNSLLYVGDSDRAARKAYAKAQPGVNTWNQPDLSYGVTFAKWNARRGDYDVLAAKFGVQS